MIRQVPGLFRGVKVSLDANLFAVRSRLTFAGRDASRVPRERPLGEKLRLGRADVQMRSRGVR